MPANGITQQTPADEISMRRDFVHFLRDACNSPERAQSALETMGKYLEYAKAQLEQTGKTQLVLDNDIIMNYIACEDVLIRYQAKDEEKAALRAAVGRLALIIQNMHNLMTYTTVRKFENCTHQLFRRYITVCSLLGDTQRARSAWRALERTGHVHMLQDVDMNMLYVETLLQASRRRDDSSAEEYLSDAIQELGKWQVRPPGEKGAHVADGHADGAVPRNFSLYSHGTAIGITYREALYCLFQQRDDPELLHKIHALLTQFRKLRLHIRHDEPVPDALLVGVGHAHNLMTTVAQHCAEDDVTPPEVLGGILEVAVEDMSAAVEAHRMNRRTGARKAPVQYLDEGLAQQVLLLCGRTQNARPALGVLHLLERSLVGIPVPQQAPPAGATRLTAPRGSRVPHVNTYLTAIEACAEDPGEGNVLEGLRLVCKVERLYAPDGLSKGEPLIALDPVRHLGALSARIGRSTDSWRRAWADVEALDAQDALVQSHLNLMIAALARLPDGASLDEAAPPAAPAAADAEEAAEAQQAGSLARKAAELHQLADKCFEQQISVHTFNALLCVFCRPDSAKDSTQLILNLLELMAEQNVTRSHETYDLLLKHWTSHRIFKAVLATVEDMREAGIYPDPVQLQAAASDADHMGLDEEAQALREVLEDMNIPTSHLQQRQSNRQIDARGRVVFCR